jgi:hypothetical protein
MAMTSTITPAQAALPAGATGIDHFAAADAAEQSGVQLRLIREAAPRFREWFAATGSPDYVGTFDLVSLPYPTKFGLWRAALSPVPFLTITNRLIVVRWNDAEGRTRTLLFEPSDVERDAETPYFKALRETMPQQFERFSVRYHGTVEEHLRRLGIRPEDVDYITFDHLHTQDVRRWIGTTTPQPDISPSRPVEPYFPNARLIVQKREIEALAELHPLQRPWFLPETYTDLRRDAIVEITGDVLLGPGLALLSTPGHTAGNHSLTLNTATGIWCSSENAIAAECMTPEESRIPGVRKWAARWGQEVIINANTIENTAQQYNSMVKEKSVVDRSRLNPRFLQFFPSSELTRNRLNPGTQPTFNHFAINHGSLTPSR